MIRFSNVLSIHRAAPALVALASAWALTACAAPPDEQAAAEDELVAAHEQALSLSPPAGCQEIELDELQNGIQLTPARYGQQPTYRGEFASFGDPGLVDQAFVRLDSDTPPGIHSLAGQGDNLYSCEQCVWAVQDSDGPSPKTFVADSGTLVLALKVNPQQTLGALLGVTLRESVPAAPMFVPYSGTQVVPGGECRWIRFATWSTIRPWGCDPREGSLTSGLPGLTCVADSYAADDGTLERSLGKKKQGQQCTYTEGPNEESLATTNCAPGYSCSAAFGEPRTCIKTCDYLAADPGCPEDTVCGPLGLCVAQSTLEAIGFAFEDVAIGEECSSPFSEFCGSEGARGLCADIDGGGPAVSKCYRYERARSACGAGEELGYVHYGQPDGGFDRTYGWCYEDGLP